MPEPVRITGMNVALRKPMTLEEFLAWEEQQELRYEFDGVGPVAMAGGTAAHDRISLNLAASLVVRLRGKPCRPCGSNLKVEVMGHVRYPDGYIACSPIVPGATSAADPVVIFEVLSKGTALTDRIIKNREYRTIATTTHYVMLEQDGIAAEVLRRDGENWISSLLGAGDTLVLPGVDIAIPLDELYEGLTFPAPAGEADVQM